MEIFPRDTNLAERIRSAPTLEDAAKIAAEFREHDRRQAMAIAEGWRAEAERLQRVLNNGAQ